MTISEILELAVPGRGWQVSNTPFVYSGRVTIVLDGGDQVEWLFSEDGRLLSLNPDTDEIIFFSPLDKEVEGDDEILVHQGDEYEFSYEDEGQVREAIDGADFDEGARVSFKDFESDEGEIIRLAVSSHVEEPMNFIGHAVPEDDILV